MDAPHYAHGSINIWLNESNKFMTLISSGMALFGIHNVVEFDAVLCSVTALERNVLAH